MTFFLTIFVAGGYVKTDTESSGGGHVGVYKSTRAQRKYNAFLFAIPPIGARAEFVSVLALVWTDTFRPLFYTNVGMLLTYTFGILLACLWHIFGISLTYF